MASPKIIGQVLAEISCLYPLLFQPTPEITAIWSLYLRDMDDELMINALRHHVATANEKERQYPPSVPALRKAASDLKRMAAGVPTAFEAWENLLAVGPGGDRVKITVENDVDGRPIIEHFQLKFSHPLVEKVARQLGWPKFPSHEDIEIDRAHFFRAFESALAKLTDQDRELPQVLAYIEQIRKPALPGVSAVVKKLEVSR